MDQSFGKFLGKSSVGVVNIGFFYSLLFPFFEPLMVFSTLNFKDKFPRLRKISEILKNSHKYVLH